MTKSQWDKLNVGSKILHYGKVCTIIRFDTRGIQAKIKDEIGFETWVGRTTCELVAS